MGIFCEVTNKQIFVKKESHRASQNTDMLSINDMFSAFQVILLTVKQKQTDKLSAIDVVLLFSICLVDLTVCFAMKSINVNWNFFSLFLRTVRGCCLRV